MPLAERVPPLTSMAVEVLAPSTVMPEIETETPLAISISSPLRLAGAWMVVEDPRADQGQALVDRELLGVGPAATLTVPPAATALMPAWIVPKASKPT